MRFQLPVLQGKTQGIWRKCIGPILALKDFKAINNRNLYLLFQGINFIIKPMELQTTVTLFLD